MLHRDWAQLSSEERQEEVVELPADREEDPLLDGVEVLAVRAPPFLEPRNERRTHRGGEERQECEDLRPVLAGQPNNRGRLVLKRCDQRENLLHEEDLPSAAADTAYRKRSSSR